VIGIASPRSESSAQLVRTRLKADFPNAVDLAWATYTLWRINPMESFGFVVDESGKVVYGYDLSWTFGRGLDAKLLFEDGAERFLKDAEDPFGIDAAGLPEACRPAYGLLKVGRFDAAKALAKRLTGKSACKDAAEKIIAAAEETERKKLDRMAELADAGSYGELNEEYKAFSLAFPRSRQKSKAKSLLSKAKSAKDNRDEAAAATNFDRAVMILRNKVSQGATLMRAIGMKYDGTYYGGIAKAIAPNMK
jgi:hypothetical protein